ncbi:MAG: acetylserotonin O-methyltransferase [Acidobacteriota bacterium]|nr:acetylserotonin O-methyltransferase [Acidobacteriota bacterium]
MAQSRPKSNRIDDLNKQLKIESPNELLELAIGFQRSQVLFSFVELEIPKILHEKNLTAKELSEKLLIDPIAMERFLNASVILGLLETDNKNYKNTALAEYFLVKGNEFYLGGQIRRYQNHSYPLWIALTEKLKSWKHGESENETPDEEDQGADSMAEQHNLALLHGYALAKAFDFSNYKRVLDLGGGTGAMSIGLCETFPNLRATVFDLPENVEKAEEFITASNLKNQIKTIGGDVTKDELPEDFDVALLANLVSVFDAETNKKLLADIYKKLPENGACIISGWILDENRLSPEISVLFCLEDICWKSPDVEKNFGVYKSWLEEAGFKRVEYKTYLEPTRLICAYK